MQKVISINLNGNAYQLDENGYNALREYLETAERGNSMPKVRDTGGSNGANNNG